MRLNNPLYNFCNPAMFRAVPVNSEVKNHFLIRYVKLINNNGLPAANSYFKNLRLLFMRLIAGEISNPQFVESLRSSRIKYDRPMRQLVATAMSQPSVVLNFLKFPTGNPQNKGDEDSTYKDLVEELSSPNHRRNLEVDVLIQKTIEFLIDEGKRPRNLRRPGLADAFAPLSQSQLGQLTKTVQKAKGHYVYPMQYADCRYLQDNKGGVYYSQQFVVDRERYKDPYLCDKGPVGEIHLVSKGTDDFRAVAVPNRFLQLELEPSYYWLTHLTHRTRAEATFNQAQYDALIQSWVDDEHITPYGVDIHHATNTLPFEHGRTLVSKLLDVHIRDLYSQYIRVEEVVPLSDNSHTFNSRNYSESLGSLVLSSYRKFEKMAKAPWKIPREGYDTVRFITGQPLGTLPSFRVLNFQNMLYAEMAIRRSTDILRGYYNQPTAQLAEKFSVSIEKVESLKRHIRNRVWDMDNNQQYVVLGDDIVFKHEDVAQYYIEILTVTGVPLSLHKSFKGKLVEFAGKVFVKNQTARYITDQTVLTNNNLFEWSRATGIPIQWNHIPFKLRGRLERRYSKYRAIAHKLNLAVPESTRCIPGVFNHIMKEVTGSTTPYGGWSTFHQLVLDASKEATRVDTNYGSYTFPVWDGERMEIYTAPQHRNRLNRAQRPVSQQAGRPSWKNTKYHLDTSDFLLGTGLAAQRWYDESQSSKTAG